MKSNVVRCTKAKSELDNILLINSNLFVKGAQGVRITPFPVINRGAPFQYVRRILERI